MSSFVLKEKINVLRYINIKKTGLQFIHTPLFALADIGFIFIEQQRYLLQLQAIVNMASEQLLAIFIEFRPGFIERLELVFIEVLRRLFLAISFIEDKFFYRQPFLFH